MRSDQPADSVVIRAPAKVNLFLEVLAKRADGYHELATLMVAIDLCDQLTFTADDSGAIALHCDLPELSAGPDNLVARAARLLQQRTGHRRGATIRLSKQIPLAAGLAGGSTDAAATLEGLNRLWRLGLSEHELAGLGAELGSDVPFFFATPAAWCTGRGERVTPVVLGRPLWFVLACPPVGLSTAAVFRHVTVPAEPLAGDEIRRAVEAGDVEAIGRGLHNRLQPAAERLCPAVTALRERLERLAPAGVLMSGSGSTVFALCRGPEEAERIARELRVGPDVEARPRVYLVQSCSGTRHRL